METNKILIQINNVSFRYHSGDYLFEQVKLTVKQGDKTAIVGTNGSGKSTLLKLLTGKLEIEEGSSTLNCSAYYVPQIDLTVTQKNLKIFEYIEEFYDEWWDVLSKLEELFELTLDPEFEVKTLSGGELMKLNLAIAIKHNPDVLILDEPTNHLDVNSINTLIKFINETTAGKYTYIIVSHNIFFLDKVVNNIWELENKKITAYGGNYSFYKEQKALHLTGIKKKYDIAKEKLEKAKQLEQRDLEKQAKKANAAKRDFIKGGIDKREFNEGKNAATTLQHGKSTILEKIMTEAEQKLENLETEERRLAFINLKNTSENVGRTVFEVKDATLSVAKKDLIKDINLKVIYGDRIVFSGNNGSGKTSLVKALIGTNSEQVVLKGEVAIGKNMQWVYIDQNYSLVKPDLNLIQSLMEYHKSITESHAKEQLGKFQFKTESEMKKLSKNLSGGEMVRLIMAMITSFPIDLVILDEPTNNLDVETVDVLITALNNFRGAVMVISHNIDFLTRINVKTAYLIKDKKFKVMGVSPANKEGFYATLTR